MMKVLSKAVVPGWGKVKRTGWQILGGGMAQDLAIDWLREKGKVLYYPQVYGLDNTKNSWISPNKKHVFLIYLI